MSLAYDPKLVFDSICTRVGGQISPLFVNWSIGKRQDVAAEIADYLNESADTINEALTDLINEGWLTDKPHVPDGCPDPKESRLGITHQGWQNWSYFNECYFADWGFEELEDWLAWDGINEPHAGHYREVFKGMSKPKPRKKQWRNIDEV
jgi:hypothetical protein